jgi:glycerophosphoryl diester phosphodiesterase
MPTLAEVLDLLAGHLPVNVEIKDATALPAVLEVLAATRPIEVILSSFDANAMVVAADVAPQWPRAVIHDRDVPEALAFAQLDAAKAAAWHTCPPLITPARVAAQRALGRPTRVWTINRAKDAQTLMQSGVAAIFTDQPARIRSKLNAH